ncbi:hypothetical protein ONE63_002971 [Megalurothrips usitatus]|uniref:Broad-complex core protein n=1 Tax=Megalurothrips usitatus TaxID=439358 RepID=A0AAV7X5W4_9NEOP|nr:hypothetical protein ONE63_002971 [Megalurothrips usitatus]
MGTSQQFSLRWNNYLRHITSAFESLRTDLDLVDVTLSCEGKKIKAHKMLLSACSSYFKDLFKENPCQHPVIVFRNVKFVDLEALIDFMYQGEVNVVQEQLASFLTTAELLAVEGLTDGNDRDLTEYLDAANTVPAADTLPNTNTSQEKKRPTSTNNSYFSSLDQNPVSPPTKRKRWSSPPSASGSQKSRTDSVETNRLPQTSSSSGATSEHNIVPVLSQVKLEMPEFIDSDSAQINYNNPHSEDNELEDISTMDHNMATGSGGSKEESLDVYGGNSSDTGDITGEHMMPAELSQVLAKAGPSSEGSHDSLQVRPGPGRLQEPGRGPALGHLGALWQAQPPPPPPPPQQQQQPQPQFTCGECGKGFQVRDSLYKHRSVHRGATTCPICNAVLNRRGYLRHHMALVHGSVHTGSSQCPVCQAVLSRRRHLKRHMLVVHGIVLDLQPL